MQGLGGGPDSEDDDEFVDASDYTIPDDVKKRVIDIPNGFMGYDKNDFDLIDEESEMVQAVLISNDEIKKRCRELAKMIFDDYKGKKLTLLGFH